jgi:hypothetical protein
MRQGTSQIDGFVDWLLDKFGRKRRRASDEPPGRVM